MIYSEISAIECVSTVLAGKNIAQIEILPAETHESIFTKPLLGHGHSGHPHF
jgi:hypothetical protein